MSKTRTQRQILSALGDMYTFVQSSEVNRSVAAVTFEQLLKEQINRNGDSERSNGSTYDPYSFDPDNTEPATQQPINRANFLSGSDTNQPTKLDRVLAIQNNVQSLVDAITALPLEGVLGADEADRASESDLLTDDPLILGTDAVLTDLSGVA